MGTSSLKVFLLLTLICLSGCSWFGFRKHVTPEPTEFIVTGAPRNSIVFVDGSPAAAENSDNDHPQVIDVAPGAHTVEIRVGDRTVYREETDVAAGGHRVVKVLSGLSR
jgi:hypothetical protein